MTGFIRSIYLKLPLVSEIRWFSALFNPNATSAAIQRMAAIHEDQYIANLLQTDRALDEKRLLKNHFQVYSQNGEDGMIAEIFRRIGTTNKHFVEIGVGNGLENNTVYLLLQNWKGLWVEADQPGCDHITQAFATPLAKDNLRLRQAFISADNIGQILDSAHCSEPDIFSLDIDYNTYWVWNAIEKFKPRVIVVEYNASFPPDVDWKAIYNKDRVWDGSNYYGASLKAYELLGQSKGYTLVGCDFSGSNAFFVRSDLTGTHFSTNTSSEFHYEPGRPFISRHAGHKSGVFF